MRANSQLEETAETVLPIEEASRSEVIARLRRKLSQLAQGDHCLCETAARLGIFCKGFKRFSDAEFNQRFGAIVRTHKRQPRQALEALAALDHWRRQEAAGAAICCDVETKEQVSCTGWNGFDARTLEGYHRKIIGTPVRIS